MTDKERLDKLTKVIKKISMILSYTGVSHSIPKKNLEALWQLWNELEADNERN